MTATQTQIRRDTSANIAIVTPALAELGYDQTRKSLIVGDGTTLGGIPIPNVFEIQRSAAITGTVGGTANAITINLPFDPGSYSDYFSVRFIATASNTGAVTIDVNGIGATQIRKIVGVATAPLETGDIISGVVYEVVYVGGLFQLVSLTNSGLISVSQGDLNTSTGTVMISPSVGSTISQHLTLPGGEYGFYPQVRRTVGSSITNSTATISNTTVLPEDYTARIFLSSRNNGPGSGSMFARQRYIASSPPFDLGDGEVMGFVYALVNEVGDISSAYIADVPPWGYNGPTNICATHVCPLSGKKYRRACKKRNLEQIMNGSPAKYEMEEITHDIKNADMNRIPHPFSEIDGHTVVLMDPMDHQIRKIIEHQNSGGAEEVVSAFARGLIGVNNDALRRNGPKGVAIHKMKFRHGRS